MDYEKKYKEALNWMKDVYPTLEGAAKEDAEHYFPEIKESEDEKIRKALIEAIRNNYTLTGYINHIPTKDILAWLEKQGEHKKFRDSIQVGDKVTRNEDGVLVNLSQLNRVAKPADKIEPKFKVGDWVVCNNGSHPIFQVIERSWPNAKYRNINGTEIFLNVNTLDKQYHLWTIQDAKDGDVLCCEQIILLFKKWEYNSYWNCVIAYAGIDMTGKLQITNEHWLVSNYVHPATKEQRDLLFQKMKEAGYEWDSENRELMKIDHKELTDFQERLRGILIESNGKYDDNTVIRLSGQVLELVEQKPVEWDKDDITRINEITETLIIVQANRVRTQRMHYNKATIDKDIDWLKSLKDKYTWKPSEEQMEALDSATENCAYSEYQDCLRELIGQLKKLREE